jgi:hypothetical protein
MKLTCFTNIVNMGNEITPRRFSAILGQRFNSCGLRYKLSKFGNVLQSVCQVGRKLGLENLNFCVYYYYYYYYYY